MAGEIERIKVTSSAFAEIGHDGDQTLELVRHPRKDGWSSVERYAPVSAETFAQILAAESAGKAFHALVRTNPHVAFSQLDPEPPKAAAV